MSTMIYEKGHFGNSIMKCFIDIRVIVMTVLITFEGIATMIVSTPLHIGSGNNFLEPTMFLLGAGTAAIGMMMPMSLNLIDERSSPCQRRVAVLIVILLTITFIVVPLVRASSVEMWSTIT